MPVKRFAAARAITQRVISTRIPKICITTFMFGLCISTALLKTSYGQDSALELLPRQEAIYIWTNDVQTMLDQTKRALIPEDSIVEEVENLAKRFAREDQRGKGASQDVQPLLDRLHRMTTLWSMLCDDEILSGQALLILPIELSADAKPNRGQTTEPKVSEAVVIARTTRSKEEIAEFLTELARMSAGDDADRDDSETLLSQLPGEWDCEDGWFCWTTSKEHTAETLDYLHKRTTAPQTLANDRSFQTVFGNLRGGQDAKHPLSIYVTAEALPYVAWHLTGDIAMLSAVRFMDWKEMLLDELRGLGARIFIADDLFTSELKSPLAIDAFLLVTQPRRGPFAALGNANDSRIILDFPTLTLPIESITQVSIDGERLLQGIDDMQQRAAASNPVLQQRLDRGDDADLQMVKLFSRFCEVEYQLDETPSDQIANLNRLLMLQASDVEQLETLLEATAQHTRISLQDVDTPLNKLNSDEIRAWARSDASVERIREMYARSNANMEEQIKNLRQSSDENSKAQIESFEAMKRTQQESIRRLEEMTKRPQIILVDSWFLAAGIDNESFQEAFIDGYSQQHYQMIELEDQVEQLHRTFGNRQPHVAVLAYWAKKLIARAKEYGSPSKTAYVPGIQILTQEPEPSFETKIMTDLVQRQIDKLILTVSSSDDGFRINGALLTADSTEVQQTEGD